MENQLREKYKEDENVIGERGYGKIPKEIGKESEIMQKKVK